MHAWATSIDPYPSPPKIPDPLASGYPAFFELRSPEMDGASATSEGLVTRLGGKQVSEGIIDTDSLVTRLREHVTSQAWSIYKTKQVRPFTATSAQIRRRTRPDNGW